MPKRAAIDIGTNSVKMTIADVQTGKPLRIIADRMEITRLGKGVEQTKSLSTESIELTLNAISAFVEEAHKEDASVVACGTSAMRDASNGEEFRQKASKLIGAEVQIISGEREAKLAFTGALSDLQNSNQSGSTLAFDIGGGSTELIVGDINGIRRSASLDIGAVRLTERALKSDPPDPSEISTVKSIVFDQLSHFDLLDIHMIIGIGGTATTLLSVLNTNPRRSNSNLVSKEELDEIIEKLEPLTVEQKREIPGLDPKRGDIILAGLLIMAQLIDKCGLDDFTISSRGVRHGLLLENVA